MRRFVVAVVAALLLPASAFAGTGKTKTETKADVADEEADQQAEAIQAGLTAAKDGLHRCWAKGAAVDLHVAGRVVLGLEFGKGGHVKKATIKSDTTKSEPLTKCVIELASTWVWGDAFAAGGAAEVPLEFQSPGVQYVVRAEDAIEYKPKGGKLSEKILLDRENVGADKASLVIMSMRLATQMPFHKHTGAEVVYVLEGSGDFEGLSAKGPDLQPGDVAYMAAGVPHTFASSCCKKKDSQFLVLYAPGGVERPFKDPAARKEGTTVAITADEIKKGKADKNGPVPKYARDPEIKELPILGGKGSVKILMDADAAGDGAAYVGHLKVQGGAQVPEHVHAEEAEILYCLSGSGDMAIGGAVYPVAAGTAVYIPPNTKHAFTASKEGFEAVQFYTPSGPEQRFKPVEKAPPAKATK